VLLIYLSCAWVAGIFLGSMLHLPWLLVLTGLAPLCLLTLFNRRKRALIFISLCLVAFFGGAIRFESSLDTSLQYYHDRGEVALRGTVAAPPEVRDKVTHLRVKASEISL